MAGSIYSWSKTAGSNATADGDINWAEGQLPSTVNDSARQVMGRNAEYRDDLNGTLTLSGTDTLTITVNSAFTTLATGRNLVAKVANDNTSTTVTLNVNGLGAKRVKVITRNGESDPVAGDLQAGMLAWFIYDSAANSAAGAWILQSAAALQAGTDVQAYRSELTLVNVTGANIASATTTDLSAATGDTVTITGTTTITGLGTVTAGIVRKLIFAGALTFTHNGTSLILPGAANITTAAGDVAIMLSLGSGNWRCLSYQRAVGDTPYRAELAKVNLLATDIASSGSIDIGAATGDYINITGTTTITALGTVAAGTERKLVFGGALTFTHNGTSLILPGAANITTVAGDVAVMVSLGSGNWRCIDYQRAAGVPAAVSTFGATLVDDADASTARTTLGVGEYSTGTWSPTLAFSTPGGSSMSYTTQSGSYIRIGNVVIASCILVVTPTIGGGSGTLRVSLPTTADAAAWTGAVGTLSRTVASDGFTWPSLAGGSTATAISVIATGAAYVLIRAHGSSGETANLSTTALVDGTQHTITFSIVYGSA